MVCLLLDKVRGMDMIGVSEIKTFRPASRLSLKEITQDLKLTQQQYDKLRKQGLKQVMSSGDMTCFDMLHSLLRGCEGLWENDDLDCIIYAHALQSHPDGHDLLDKLKMIHELQDVPAFEISDLNCASSLMAIQHACHRLRHSKKNKALILVAEKCYSPFLRTITDISIISDGAALCVLDRHTENDIILDISMYIDCKITQSEHMDEETFKWFQLSYFLGIKKVLQLSLKKTNKTLNDISLIIPHNVNIDTWSYMGKSMGIPSEKIFTENIGALGHANTCDLFLNAEDVHQSKKLKSGDLYFMISVGLGGAYTCMLMQR